MKASLEGYRQRAAITAAEVRRVKEEEAAREAAEKAVKKKGNFIQKNLPHAGALWELGKDVAMSGSEPGRRATSWALDTSPGKKATSTISGLPGVKRAWDEFNNIGTASAGAFTSPFGQLEIQQQPTGRAINGFDPEDNSGRVGSGPRTPILGPVAVRRFSPDTIKEALWGEPGYKQVRRENQMQRDAGLEVSDNPYRRVQGTGDQWYETPDVSTGVKVGVGVLADPTTWVPAGGISKLAQASRLSKLNKVRGAARVGEAASKIPFGRKLARGGAELIEGASNPLVTVGAAAGMGGAAEIAERTGMGTKSTLATILGGAAIGGAFPEVAARGLKGGKGAVKMDVRSERDAPTGRPIIRDTSTGDGGLATRKYPNMKVNERMYFHGSTSKFDDLDPTAAPASVNEITEGAGLYLAAAPENAWGYGSGEGGRIFATEFNGKALNLMDDGTPALWDEIASDLGLPGGVAKDDLQYTKDTSREPAFTWSDGYVHGVYQDALIRKVAQAINDNPAAYPRERIIHELGRFSALADSSPHVVAQGIVSNALESKGYDGTSHFSIDDGEVLIAFDGAKLRTVGVFRDPEDAINGAQSWNDIKATAPRREYPPLEPEGDWVNRKVARSILVEPGTTSKIRQFSGGGMAIVTSTPGEGARAEFHRGTEVYRNNGMTPAEADSWVAQVASGDIPFESAGQGLRFTEYGPGGGISEEGQISAAYAAALAVPAAGAAIGYGLDGEEGAVEGAGIGALGVGAALGARGLLGRADPTNIPGKGALPGQPAPPLPKAPLSTGIDRFSIGTAAHDRAGTRIGEVVGINGTTGELTIDAGKGGIITRPANAVYSFSDYSAFLELHKTNRARKIAAATQPMIDRARTHNEEYLRPAREAVRSGHYMARLFPKIGSLVDPGARFISDDKRRVHAAILASANMIHRGDSIAVATADRTLKILDPLMGGGRTAGLRRAGAQVASVAAPTAAGILATQLTGDEEWQEVGLLGAGVAGGAMSVAQRRGFMTDTPWKKIPPRDPLVLTGKIKDAGSQERLTDIIQYWDGPDGYDFSGLDPRLQAALATAKKEWDAEELRQLQEVNAALAAGGQQPIPFREKHGVLASYTPKSLNKAGITNEYADPLDIRVTSFRKEQAIEKRRNLGDTLREVLAKEPELELAGGVRDLFVQQIRQQERIKAGALVTADMLEGGLARQFPDDIAQKAMTPAQRATIAKDKEVLGKDGWRAMPGVDDVLFHPEAVKTVKELLVSGRGADNAAVNFLDAATNVARTALFVGDLNAWTLQGAMTALQNPYAALRNFIPLVGATVFGERYANHFKMTHPELVDKAAMRGVRSYEHGGLEREFPGVHQLPGVRNLEERAIAFLDVMRLSMQDNITQQEALLKGFSPRAKRGFRGTAGGVIQGDVGHIALETARNSGLVGGVGAVVLGEGIGGEDASWQDNLMTVALGFGGSMAADMAIGRAGQGVINRRRVNGRSSDLEVEAGVIGGKTTNRISGTQNRQQQGISARQAQIERVALMRSPALTRNVLTMAKLAATDKGPEGAVARIYLIKTAVFYGGMMAFFHAAKQGRMPDEEDFNPENPLSPFAPGNFGKADFGRGGSAAFSNPAIALVRAFLYNDHPAGEAEWHVPDGSEVGMGLTGFLANRTPDITGPLVKPIINKLASGIPDTEPTPENPGLINRIENGDLFGIGTDVMKTVLPVSASAAIDTGVLDRTALGQRLGTLKGDPNYNYGIEEAIGVGAAWAGLNSSPESLGKELVVRKDEETDALFPGKTYATLNDEQQSRVRDRLDVDSNYALAKEGRKAQGGGDEIPQPIDQYFAAQKSTNDAMASKLESAEALYRQTGDAQQFRKRLGELATERRTRLDQVQSDLADASAKQRGQDMTVEEWLNRNMQPEDKAVEKYYDLFEKATNPGTGALDFDQLEELQADYLASLPRSTRSYVERRTSFKRELTPGQQEYEGVKAITKPYFEAREVRFKQYQNSDKFLGQFKNYNEFKAFTKTLALSNGISETQALDAIALRNPGVKMYQKMTELDGKLMRLKNPELDAALVKWYGYAPQNPTAKLQRKLGRIDAITSPPSVQEYRRGAYSDSVATKSGFKRRARLWEQPVPTR